VGSSVGSAVGNGMGSAVGSCHGNGVGKCVDVGAGGDGSGVGAWTPAWGAARAAGWAAVKAAGLGRGGRGRGQAVPAGGVALRDLKDVKPGRERSKLRHNTRFKRREHQQVTQNEERERKG
jgi:hypothetical protein